MIVICWALADWCSAAILHSVFLPKATAVRTAVFQKSSKDVAMLKLLEYILPLQVALYASHNCKLFVPCVGFFLLKNLH